MIQYRYTDCQGFAGGMSVGATQAGFQLVAKLEKKGGYGVPMMEANRAFLGDGWQSQVGDPSEWDVVPTDVVVGTPPCSAFSGMTHGMGSAHGVNSDINQCMWDLFGYAARVRPAAVVMESVAFAYSKGRSLMRELVDTLNATTKLSYRLTHVLQDNYSTGGATHRRRYFLVASQMPFGVELPELKRLPTFGDAVGDLVHQPIDWELNPYAEAATWYSARYRAPDGLVDGHELRQNRFTQRLSDIHAGAGWHDGEREADVLLRYYENHSSLPESYQYETPGKALTRDKQLIERNLDPGGFNQTKAWRWDKPGRVISGAGPYMVWNSRAGRLLTNREAARVMGFPDEWRVASLQRDPKLSSYWGKGTSVAPANWVMTWLNRSLNGEPGSVVGERLDHRDRLVNVTDHWKSVKRYEDVTLPGL